MRKGGERDFQIGYGIKNARDARISYVRKAGEEIFAKRKDYMLMRKDTNIQRDGEEEIYLQKGKSQRIEYRLET